jgi:hypothetical protein
MRVAQRISRIEAIKQRAVQIGLGQQAFEVIAPFFAWRGLVVASPVWYPSVPDATRHTLLRFVERLLDGMVFDPFDLDPLLAP